MLVAETAVASQDGLHETVTLWAETATPRRRPVSESYKRVRTPLGELPPARRRRKKTESMVRSRAVLKLHPIEHDRHLEADRARKKEAARREQAAREARERDAAELAEQAAQNAAQLERETAQKAAELEREAAQRSAQKAEAQRRFNYLWRFLRKQRCGSCTTCAPGGRVRSRASAPCEMVLSRLEYTASERAIVCDPAQRFARSTCGGYQSWQLICDAMGCAYDI